jgi:hypothetical protein
MSVHPVPAHRLWLLVLGFGVWCSALITVYALHSIGCTFAWSVDKIRISLGLAILAHLVLIGWLWQNYAKPPADPALGSTGSFLHWVIVWTLIAAVVTIVFTLGPALLLTSCT